MSRVRAFYGAGPLHLLATVISFAIIAAAVISLAKPGSDARGVFVWLLGSVIAVELVLIPLAWVLDRIAFGPPSHRISRPAQGAGGAYVRVPALLSGMLLIVFAPLILRLDDADFQSVTGIAPTGRYLVRWLLATAVMYALSALIYALRSSHWRRAVTAAAPGDSRGERDPVGRRRPRQ